MELLPYRIRHNPNARKWFFQIEGLHSGRVQKCQTLEDAYRVLASEFEEAADFCRTAPWMTAAILDLPIEAVSNRRAGIPQS